MNTHEIMTIFVWVIKCGKHLCYIVVIHEIFYFTILLLFSSKSRWHIFSFLLHFSNIALIHSESIDSYNFHREICLYFRFKVTQTFVVCLEAQIVQINIV